MKKISIDQHTHHLHAEVRQLYESAFPKEEQIPFDELLELLQKMPISFEAYYEDDTFIGLTIVLRRADFNWFWYFAVNPDKRGCGYGQQILQSLIKQYAYQPLILDIELPTQAGCPNAGQRQRRYAFYLRNGFRDTHTGKSFEGIDYTILMHGDGVFTQVDYDQIIHDLRACWQHCPDEDN